MVANLLDWSYSLGVSRGWMDDYFSAIIYIYNIILYKITVIKQKQKAMKCTPRQTSAIE